MITKLISLINGKESNGWKPRPHQVIKESSLAETIYREGIAVVPFINEEILTKLRRIFDANHQMDYEKGGMFYSLYSLDVEYRKRIDAEIREILTPFFNNKYPGRAYFILPVRPNQSAKMLTMPSSAV